VSENIETTNASAQGLKLNGLFAFKEGMATIYNEQGEAVPVTVLRYEPWFVSQIKTNEADGYDAIQLACEPKKAKNSNKAEKGHLKGAGFENGAKFVKELRQVLPEGVVVGAQISIDS
jgi:large subunit ribosomal protein L3